MLDRIKYRASNDKKTPGASPTSKHLFETEMSRLFLTNFILNTEAVK